MKWACWKYRRLQTLRGAVHSIISINSINSMNSIKITHSNTACTAVVLYLRSLLNTFSDVGTSVRISVQSHELVFFLSKIKQNQIKSCPTSGERLIRGYTKFDFTVEEGKEWLDPSRKKN